MRMSVPSCGQSNLVQSLAALLRNNGDSVLDGTSTLTLRAGCLQHLTRLFQQYIHSRAHQHGFLALPSHPADTPSMLQVQFLFDMLQKTISLKLINPSGSRLQSVVKIFPFKSLRYLELKRIPPHCLEGLRAVYSQLQVFICSKSVSSLEELLSLCGGDLSSALTWLELHTLNFSYNSITCLDDSLGLLNVLRSLDLSHNKIQDCGEFLLPLSDLQHLNLGYNFLQRVPLLGMSCRAKLVKLVLRNNELETINGVEHLCSLQHLDLAYNLLMEHSQLSPLLLLHNLNTLTLEGNPLYFHKTHRLCTVRHLSPKAAFLRLKLDGCQLSSSELAILPRPGQLIGHTASAVAPAAVATERGPQDVSSGAGEMSDSLSLSEPAVTRLHRKKSRNKVRVRRASISEPSDTDHDLRNQPALQDIVLRHQKEIERMESFRDQLGEDWLRYQHHLEVAPVTVEKTDHTSAVNGRCSPAPPPIAGPPCTVSQPPQLDNNTAPLLTSEPKVEASEPEAEPETESTLQWPGHSAENTESTLDTSLGELQAQGSSGTLPQEEEEEEDLGVDMCLPLLVGVLSEAEEEQGVRKAPCPRFLRVKPGLALEVDMQSGRVLARLELDSLQRVTTSEATWTEKQEERCVPALELHFSYISRTRRRRCYAMLDDDPQQALQALVDVLSRVAEENESRNSEGRPQGVRLQCLKCRAEFYQQGEPGPLRQIPGEGMDGEEEYSGQDAAGNMLICPECSSDHVVQLPGQSYPSTSTPVQCSSEDEGGRRFAFNDTDTPMRLKDPAVGGASLTSGSPTYMGEATALEQTGTFLTAKSGIFYIGDGDSLADGNLSQAVSFHTPDGPSREELSTSHSYSAPQPPGAPLRYMEGSSPAQFNLLTEDFEAVDHRLKLFLDMEVFENNSEELHCFLKMSAVKFGDPAEFPSLLVVSDQSFYILEITMEMQGQPSDWLLKRESHRISELCYLEVGLGSQSIHMEFQDGGAAYTLLVRDSARCKHFFGLLTGIVRELAHKSNSKLKSISTTRLNPQHHLWPLLCETTRVDGAEDCQPQFFYLLAFTQQGDSLSPVTVLATQETLYLLNEDHQWCKSLPDPMPNEDEPTSGGRVTVQETQPISCVSSVHLFASDPCRVNINVYDEMEKEEKTWALRSESAELVQALVDWVRTQWEAMFGVKLMTCLQEMGS
ncbi:serine/threonine-protein kinase 11-interacting protein [Megalops cyprinoides]|uniref:serine/threonine-protein kinase 11-interacting protein n=1 Tax=Megalops cyprinoides TaxID=118141 RepID=UPI001863D4C3|nr:serine/threonine-protein kinase 11-interacting protein [Megalops cyprinoides]